MSFSRSIFKYKIFTVSKVTISETDEWPIVKQHSVFDKSLEFENFEIDENWSLDKLIVTVDCNNLSEKKNHFR